MVRRRSSKSCGGVFGKLPIARPVCSISTVKPLIPASRIPHIRPHIVDEFGQAVSLDTAIFLTVPSPVIKPDIMKVITALAMMVSLASRLLIADALVGSSWTVSNVPASGLRDITFPMTMVQVDHISGYYFAQQFGFVGSSIGYTGLQPRPDRGGRAVIHAVFSSFIAGSRSTDPNCSDGADGGAGVSCSFEFNGVYGRTYNLEVKGSGQLWTGTAIDTVTGARIHIGSYTLPSTAGGIQSSQAGFVEWYPWNGGEPPNHCAKLPYQQTIFGVPTTTNPGSVGSQSLAYEYGDCVGQVAFSTQRYGGGMINNCGFRGATGTEVDTDAEDFNYQDAFVAVARALLP